MFAFDFDEVEINGMEHQRQRFQEDQNGHDVVYSKNGMSEMMKDLC